MSVTFHHHELLVAAELINYVCVALESRILQAPLQFINCSFKLFV